MSTITYAITDDHKIFRTGLKLILDDDKKLEFVGEAENGYQLLELLKNNHIDVVLLDLKMPEMDGFEVAKRIRAQNTDTKIIILTMHDDAQFIVRLMETGANGYLVKNTDPEEVKTAIYSVMESGYYFNDHVSNAMLKTLINKNIAPGYQQQGQQVYSLCKGSHSMGRYPASVRESLDITLWRIRDNPVGPQWHSSFSQAYNRFNFC